MPRKVKPVRALKSSRLSQPNMSQTARLAYSNCPLSSAL